jgi:transposase
VLDPATQAEVLRLFFADHLSQREISEKLSIHRQTVAAVVQRKQVLLERQNKKSRRSILAPYYDHIEKLLQEEPGRSAVNVLQKLRDIGYLGGQTIVKDYLSIRRAPSQPKAYLSLEFIPGQAAQVDWGDFGDPFGLKRKLWCFLMVMCWSRLLYIEFTLSANFESFIRCHENAFHYFGGIPKEIWYDNLATVVAERKQKIIRFNPKFLAYSGHCHFKPVACNLAAGNEKGRVEDSVRYVRGNFWPGRSFSDWEDSTIQAHAWLNQFANKRMHRSTRKIPELHFAQEQSCLLPLAPVYDTDEIRSLKASHQFRVQFDANEYSVPWRLSGRILTLRADEKTVEIYLNHKRVCRHQRCWKKGKLIDNPKHKEGLLEYKPGAQTSSDIETVKALGLSGQRYLGFMTAQNRSIRTELRSLMVLITIYGPQAVEQCMVKALEKGIIGADHLERMLTISENRADTKPPPLSLTDERLKIPPNIPNLKTYDALLLAPEPNDKIKEINSWKT